MVHGMLHVITEILLPSKQYLPSIAIVSTLKDVLWSYRQLIDGRNSGGLSYFNFCNTKIFPYLPPPVELLIDNCKYQHNTEYAL